MSEEAYRRYFEGFDPVRYRPAERAALARRAGQRYAVMTAKHHDGFCLFDSALTDYKATDTPAGRDLISEYVEAFRAAGLRVGHYTRCSTGTIPTIRSTASIPCGRTRRPSPARGASPATSTTSTARSANCSPTTALSTSSGWT